MTVTLANVGGQLANMGTTYPNPALWDVRFGTTRMATNFNGVFTCNGGFGGCSIPPGNTGQAKALFLPSPGPSGATALLSVYVFWDLNVCPAGTQLIPGCYYSGWVTSTARVTLP